MELLRCSQFAPASRNRRIYYVSAARTDGVHNFQLTVLLIVGVTEHVYEADNTSNDLNLI